MLQTKEIVLTKNNKKHNFLDFKENIVKVSMKDERGNTGKRMSFFGPTQQYNLNLNNFSENIDIVMASCLIAKVPYTCYPSINLIFSSKEFMNFQQTTDRAALNKSYYLESTELLTEKGKYKVEFTTSNGDLIKDTYYYNAVKPDLTKNYSCAEIKIVREKKSNKIVLLDIRFYMNTTEYNTVEKLANKVEEILSLNNQDGKFQWVEI